MRWARWLFGGVCLVFVSASDAGEPLKLQLRTRTETGPETKRYHAVTQPAEWDAAQTAIVVCDMWDKHWCPQATQRVGEMAPRMNDVLKAARKKGTLIIHCPSDTLEFYKDHPARKRAQAAPVVEAKRPLERWCRIDPAKEPPLPIDDTDGGCDCAEPVKNYRAWSRQIATLEIDAEKDAITDSAEAYYLMQQRGIRNVIVMGVHTNMCVLGRPFSIRQMVYQGMNVALMRDLTDTMYNPAKSPFVSHFSGTDLVVEHIEKYWCPTLVSGDFLDGKEFRFPGDKRPHVAIVMAEDEYKTSTTLPAFAAKELGKDFRVSLLFASEKNKNDIPGLEALDEADVLLLSARRRPLPKAQLDRFRKFIAAKRPVVGIRTATHPFHLRNQKPPEGLQDWPTFDPDVIGSNYSNHHGNDLKAWVWPLEGIQHPILDGIPAGELPVAGSLYVVSPLAKNATELMRGKVEGIAQQEPVTWTFTRPDGGKSVYTSLGHPDNFTSPVFVRLLSNMVYWAAGVERVSGGTGVGACGGEEKKTSSTNAPASSPPSPRTPAPPHWTSLPVPGTWDSHRPELKTYDGYAWYRATVTPPATWKGRGLYLYVEKVDNACETYFNGVKVGVSGTLPPNYESGLASNEHRYVIPADAVKIGAPNVVAIRVYDHDGAGGFKGRAPHLLGGNEAISLEGPWQFRTGDDVAWALKTADDPSLAGLSPYTTIGPVPKLSPFATVINRRPQDHPLSAEESRSRFKVPADLEVDLVLAEPLVSQPLFLNFDERGRMWVLQYLQYPEPAGLKLLSKDQWWRAVYDKVPLPPPHGVKGRDKITIHEDTDGDGTFDKHKTFVDGLNIATAFAQGRGGVFVLNPPYLLFYPDKNRDDVPDADPEVLLEGFGIEDTHSVVNSLRWGPDGWLYAAQGSTVSAMVKRPGDKTGIASQGQNIWRYHPELKKYEIFSEGGGNAFGVEFDAAGRVFSGHNGGNTRGFHYMQGAFLQKGFNKHGALGNPYAFGYFPAMEHGNYARFTHQFVVYEADALPEQYRGLIFGVNPINSHVVMSERIPVGSTFKTKDVGFAIESADSWFRPVDIKDGPDGNLYVADWYDGQLAHTANYQGGIDKDRGRIYRIRSRVSRVKSQVPDSPERKLRVPTTRDELVKELASPSRWHRQTALRLLADQPTTALGNTLHDQLIHSGGTVALESLWALGVNHELIGGRVVTALVHPEPQVRAWAWRLWFDHQDRLPERMVAPFMAALDQETDIHVLCQIACSAKRIGKADQALPIVRTLMKRSQCIDDPRFPLLVWWALEAKVQPEREAVLDLFDDPALWREPLVEKELLPRLMRRFAATGQRTDLAACAQLLKKSPTMEASAALMRGFEEAYQGRSLANVPPDLVLALSLAGGGSLTLKVRQGDAAAIAEALKFLANEKASSSKRLEYAALFGEVKSPLALGVLLDVLGKSTDEGLKGAILGALPGYNDERIPQTVLAQYGQYTDGVRAPAQALLASRKPWALAFVQAVSRGDIPAKSIPLETVRQLTMHRDPALQALVQQLWGSVEGASTAEMQAEQERIASVLNAGEGGDPYPGKKLYMQSCGKCHKLHEQGGQIGPDLTTFKRDDVPRLLLNILNPSAEIREGFEMHIAVVDDGRVVQGFLVEQDPQVLVLRNTEGATIALERSSIEEHQVLKKSLMPEGLLRDLSETDLRNLFAYLRSGQPLAD